MPRIVFPTDFAGEQTLFSSVLKQHKALGAKSPLIAFAKQQKIDLVLLEAAITPSAEQDALSESLKRSSENNTQQRDLKFDDVWTHFLAAVHFLTGFYKGSERELGDWGITVNGVARIVYPPSFAERAKLVEAFYAVHNNFPAGESPLQPFIDENEIDVAAELEAVSGAKKNEEDKNQQIKDSELATQTRNKLWDPVVKVIHLIGKFLMGLYAADSRKMGVWGFDVVEDAAGEREQNSKINPLETKVQKSIVIPSVFLNSGENDLHVWKGVKKDGEPTVVKPGGQLGMTKGYSAITIYNPSSLVVGKYKVMIHV